MTIRFCAALMICFGSLLADAGMAKFNLREQLSLHDYQRISLRRTADNRLYSSGRLEGKRASFLVDTGWSLTTVSREGDTEKVTLSEIQLDRAIFAGEPARQQAVIMGGQRASFDVVLGLDFLRRHFAIVDCAGGQLFTRDSALGLEAAEALERVLQRAGYIAVELTVLNNSALTAPATLNGNSFALLVDSGAAWTCLDWPQADAWGLQARPSTTKLSGAGNTGKRGLAVAEVTRLRLGSVVILRAMVGLVDLKDWGLGQPNHPLASVKGLLGGEILTTHDALIDCGALKLWLKPKR